MYLPLRFPVFLVFPLGRVRLKLTHFKVIDLIQQPSSRGKVGVEALQLLQPLHGHPLTSDASLSPHTVEVRVTAEILRANDRHAQV